MKKSLACQLSPDLQPPNLEKQRDSRDRPRFAQHEQRNKDDTIDEIANVDSLAVGVCVLQLAGAAEGRAHWQMGAPRVPGSGRS